jgi:lipopolysaccharide biosynthesis regulator YciM
MYYNFQESKIWEGSGTVPDATRIPRRIRANTEKARGLAALEAGREAEEIRRKEELEHYMEINLRQVRLLERHRCQKCGVLVAPATRVYHPVYCVG